jgi:hypothetical protein
MPSEPWAIFGPDNRPVFLEMSLDESTVWMWFMGWPDEDEIRAKKALGFRAARVTVTEVPA